MFRFKSLFIAGSLIFLFSTIFSRPVFAASTFDPQLAPIQESKALKLYQKRPKTELSKIIYLIDRFKEAKIKIVYEDIYFDVGISTKVAKWFLSQRYRKETAKEWIFLYCNQSIIERKLIWVADEKGGFKLSREVLMDELKALEEVTGAASQDKGTSKS